MNEKPIIFSGPMVRAILDGTKTQTRRIINRLSGIGKITELRKSDTPGYDWQFRDSRMMWNDLPNDRFLRHCPQGRILDFLWVRETFALETWTHEFGDEPPIPPGKPYRKYHDDDLGEVWEWPHYKATDPAPELAYDDAEEPTCRWQPSIHMPRWASRLTLEIVSVRVERVQDITPVDARAEGIAPNWAGELSGWSETEHGYTNYSLPEDWDSEGEATLLTPVESFSTLWDSINAKRGYGWNLNPWVWVIQFKRIEPAD